MVANCSMYSLLTILSFFTIINAKIGNADIIGSETRNTFEDLYGLEKWGKVPDIKYVQVTPQHAEFMDHPEEGLPDHQIGMMYRAACEKVAGAGLRYLARRHPGRFYHLIEYFTTPIDSDLSNQIVVSACAISEERSSHGSECKDMSCRFPGIVIENYAADAMRQMRDDAWISFKDNDLEPYSL